MAVEASLATVTQSNMDNATLIADNTDLLNNTLLPALQGQLVGKDYIEINRNRILLDQATSDPPIGAFNVCIGETVEFHLAMSDEPGLDMNDSSIFSTDNKVTGIQLLADGIEVAVSNVTDEVVRGHQHSLFYKNTNDTGMPIAYTIVVNADIGDAASNPATIEIGNLQWGYRTYEDGYVLGTNPTANVC